MTQYTTIYRPEIPLRFVTASSLFDGHDASINIMRRILQSSGAEVIHLGHNHSVKEVVSAAIEEDANAIAISSYQGGHMEYFRYIIDLLKEYDAAHIKVFGGGGGTIIPKEVKALHAYGVSWIFTPEDGRQYGLQGMINRMLQITEEEAKKRSFKINLSQVIAQDKKAIAEAITYIESAEDENKQQLLESLYENENKHIPVLGITGTGGAGKSSLTDELIRRFSREFPDRTIALVSIDPSKRKTGGALLGDRIRMNAIYTDNVYMRSLATRESRSEVSEATKDIIALLKTAGFDFVIVETSGIGQGDAEITHMTDLSMYVMTAEFGAPTQLEKIDMIDLADFIAINKFEQKGSLDAFNQVRKQYERSHLLFGGDMDEFPVFGTIASQFNDSGVDTLFHAIITKVNDLYDWSTQTYQPSKHISDIRQTIIPNEHIYYLREISATVRSYHEQTERQCEIARRLYQLDGTKEIIQDELAKKVIEARLSEYEKALDITSKELLESWDKQKAAYSKDKMTFMCGIKQSIWIFRQQHYQDLIFQKCNFLTLRTGAHGLHG